MNELSRFIRLIFCYVYIATTATIGLLLVQYSSEECLQCIFFSSYIESYRTWEKERNIRDKYKSSSRGACSLKDQSAPSQHQLTHTELFFLLTSNWFVVPTGSPLGQPDDKQALVPALRILPRSCLYALRHQNAQWWCFS